MSENLIAKGQRVLSQEGMKNWDRIFGDRRVVVDLDYFERGGQNRRNACREKRNRRTKPMLYSGRSGVGSRG